MWGLGRKAVLGLAVLLVPLWAGVGVAQTPKEYFDVAKGKFINVLYNANTRVGRLLPKVNASYHWEGAQKIWLAGDGGAILSTSDGGGSWRHAWTGTHENLRAIVVLNPKDLPLLYSGINGVAVGEKGSVLFSRDWGMTWKVGGKIAGDDNRRVLKLEKIGFEENRKILVFEINQNFHEYTIPELIILKKYTTKINKMLQINSIPIPIPRLSMIVSQSSMLISSIVLG